MSTQKQRPGHSEPARHTCGVCGQSFRAADTVAADLVMPRVAQTLDRRAPDWRRSGHVCRADLNAARRWAIEDMLVEERGELTALDREVVEGITRHQTLTADVDTAFQEKLTLGARLADRVASFGGSWTFIIAFGVVLVTWMAFNSIVLFTAERFDPYPYILLNLVLSCIAAVQAPFIMMSQQRQEAKDRLRAQNDYVVNLKAELEIRQLHDKLDHLLTRQWERLAEIQQVQIDLLEDISRDRRR